MKYNLKFFREAFHVNHPLVAEDYCCLEYAVDDLHDAKITALVSLQYPTTRVIISYGTTEAEVHDLDSLYNWVKGQQIKENKMTTKKPKKNIADDRIKALEERVECQRADSDIHLNRICQLEHTCLDSNDTGVVYLLKRIKALEGLIVGVGGQLGKIYGERAANPPPDLADELVMCPGITPPNNKPLTNPVRFERPCFYAMDCEADEVVDDCDAYPAKECRRKKADGSGWDVCEFGGKSPHLAEYRGEAPKPAPGTCRSDDHKCRKCSGTGIIGKGIALGGAVCDKCNGAGYRPNTCCCCEYQFSCRRMSEPPNNCEECEASFQLREAEEKLKMHTDQCRQHMSNIKTWMAPSFNSHCTDAMCIMDGKVRKAKREVERLKSALHDAEAIGDFPAELRDRLALKEHAELQERLAKEAEARAEKAEANAEQHQEISWKAQDIINKIDQQMVEQKACAEKAEAALAKSEAKCKELENSPKTCWAQCCEACRRNATNVAAEERERVAKYIENTAKNMKQVKHKQYDAFENAQLIRAMTDEEKKT